MSQPISQPDALGHWGPYGGRFVPETLMAPLEELTAAYESACDDEGFHSELDQLLHDYAGRPTPLFFAGRLTERCCGARIYLKREDLLHTGAHKINNTLGQILLARRMGKRRIIAETGAGQHGVATATVCALFGLQCVVYMGAEDMRRQALNVFRMQLLGAEVREVNAGSRTLKDAINEALRDWVTNVADTYYLLGSALGPHPYPLMVRDFQSVIGREALGQHAARFNAAGGGRPGVLQGTMSYVLQDANGQVAETHSVSAGLDYPSIGPEHAFLHDSGRVEYGSVSDAEALSAFQLLSQLEGIIPALESSHAVAHAIKVARDLRSDDLMIVNLSGRGDKDINSVREQLES